MKRSSPLWLACLVPLVLAGCGPAPSAPHVRTLTPPGLSAHPCTPRSYYMQCIGPLPPSTTRGATRSQYGFDFAWGGPSGSVAHAGGARFAASYLSRSSKDWTAALLGSYRVAGVAVVFVWETAAARSLDGYGAGYSDAYLATHEAAALGYGPGTHIDFASDFDTSSYGSRFVPYYQGAAAWARRAGDTIGAYGGLHTVEVLCADRIGSEHWQTLAWSGGVWAPPSCAPLRQTGINDRFAGYSIDNDAAVAVNYGQEPAVVPAPRLVCFGPRAQLRNRTCEQVRSDVARQSRARASTGQALRRNHCQKPYRRAICRELGQRYLWFDHRARATVRTYS